MKNDIIIYNTEDGRAKINLKYEDGTVWLNQNEIAELFQTSKQNISKHIKSIFQDNELEESPTVNYKLTVQKEGNRDIRRQVAYYSLDMILAIGYRVRSVRGVQFRNYATTILKEYLIKGFAMDDERLKNLGGGNYFKELLDRIRDIRSSEKVLKSLNALVSGYLDFAERQAQKEVTMTMRDWVEHVDNILTATGEDLLKDHGKISRKQMIDKVTDEYKKYSQKTLTQVEKDYLDEIKRLEKIGKEKSQK
ncbi:MAG: RhuM family protein [Fusobacterium necrophorum]|nr:RhuM family protein [Fusobacterium necrophorum]